ncbi:unnamed protein product [Pedinophyceae sp. YPF-701]|nr:unnamed protein product [Pedinophyceae sp. YPF-701]
MRKKIDSRVRTLIENCVKTRERSFFVVVGDKGRDQVVNLHYILTRAQVKARPSVLWCYKKELYLSSHKKKRMNQIKKMAQRGLLDPEKEDPFALFVAATNIRYAYYNETQKILGNTFGMCVLQDFEALTPNLLARTIETVEGGGAVVLLLSNLESLTQLYSLTMDVHARLRTEAHGDVVGRFNERLVLSLASNPNCLLVDDELNVLPTSTLARHIAALPPDHVPAWQQHSAELRELTDSLADAKPAGPLVAGARTMDQARAVVTFLDAAAEKTLRSTVALTAARGRGKSAALGLAIAGALALGYSNIFVTAPSPENLKTLFEFVFKGLDSLEYKEHLDYDLVESTNPEWGRCVVRVNVYKNHRQTVQYIQPQHHAKLAQAELLVIDEAAAIPLPIVKALLGPYLVFLCSTVNGYEGTGRSLSLKLIQQLREQGAKVPAVGADGGSSGQGGRTLREVSLTEPIRYAPGDQVEKWLHELLCLNAAEHVPPAPLKLPHPNECELFYVERDTLFSYHRASEALLQRMMALYVSSHYRNTPNDLVLMSDAPAHRLFVLLGPVDQTDNALPDVLCVIQVALEGAISRDAARASLARGTLPQGDLIPWTIGQQFQDPEFPGLSGARIVRIAVHPELSGAGYGSRAMQLLEKYYQGELVGLGEDDAPGGVSANGAAAAERGKAAGGGDLHTEKLKPRSGLPPLLTALQDRAPESLQYLGVSFGLTQQLYSFWSRRGFQPVYLRQTASETTGEHTVVLIKPLRSEEVLGTEWIVPFASDFRVRLTSLLAGPFRHLAPALALTMLSPKTTFSESEVDAVRKGADDSALVVRADAGPLTPHDLRRLEAYTNNLVDYHMVLDLVPPLARSYFAGKVPATLSYAQAAILLSMGLQMGTVDDAQAALGLPDGQVLALFNKALRRMFSLLKSTKEAAVERTLPKPKRAAEGRDAIEEDLDDELNDHAAALAKEAAEKLKAEDLMQFAIRGTDAELDAAVGGARGGLKSGKLVSVAGAARKGEDGDAAAGAAVAMYKKNKDKKDKGRRKSGEGRTPSKKHKR